MSHSSITYDVIIIGGGLSGLSAAVELSARGKKILLLEQRPFLGGRTYSFIDETTGDTVDNGQHLLMGCYHETRRYLKRIGSEHLATLQPNLHIDFLHPQRGKASLACPAIPSPLHVLTGLLRLQSLSFNDRLKLLRVGLELFLHSSTKEQRLQHLTVDEWLTSLGQTSVNKKYLWDIIAIGTLNDDPKTVSALLFFRVLRAAFAGTREDSSLLIPRVGLSELLVGPAVRFLKMHGAEIRTDCGVKEILTDGNSVQGVRCEDGSVVTARTYISALPYYALQPLFHDPTLPLLSYLTKFESSPIVTIHLWLDRSVMEEDFVALLDLRVQWIFNKSGMFVQSSVKGRQYLSLVISGAAEYVAVEKDQLVALAMEDMRRVLSRAASATVVHSLVIKEKRATFSPTPDIEPLRPSAESGLSNFLLAGDWTNTGYPATIEGAVLSGKRAAALVDVG
ncbi:MAG TPA: hydroxysqualene dehydroxylase HpnE [Bacteroidota bacterium]